MSLSDPFPPPSAGPAVPISRVWVAVGMIGCMVGGRLHLLIADCNVPGMRADLTGAAKTRIVECLASALPELYGRRGNDLWGDALGVGNHVCRVYPFDASDALHTRH